MKVVRVVGIALGVLAVLSGATVAMLYATFDEKAIKDELMRQVEVRTGRRLAIDGELALSVWPDVGVRLGRVTLSEVAGKTEFAALDSARIAVAVLPLLAKRLEARHVEIDGLVLTLIKRQDGSLNISDLLASSEKPAATGEAARTSGKATEPLHIEVAGLALRQARLTWRDEGAGKMTELANLDLTSGRLFGDVATRSFELEKLALSTHGKSGEQHFELSLDVPSLKLSGDSVSGKSLDLLARLHGDQRTVAAKVAIGGITGSARRLAADRFSLDLEATMGDSAIKATLTSPLSYELSSRTLALEKLLGGLDIASPAWPMKPLELPLVGHFGADLAKQTAHLALDTRLDESAIALKLAVDQFSPLVLGFGLAIDRLNVDRYLSPVADAGAATKTGARTSPAAEGKIDLAALKGLNLRGSVKIGQLQVRHLKLAKLEARLSAANGQLDIAPLSAGLYGGTLDGSLRLSAGSQQFEIKQTLDGINIQPLLKDLLGKEPLEGRGSLSLDLVTRGETVTALKNGLRGRTALSLKDGAVKGINVAKLLREVKAGLAGKPPTVAASMVEKTDFSALSATFKVAAGVAHNDDLLIMSPFLRIGGAGEIDLGNERIDYLARISVVNTATGQAGKSLAALKGVTVPLRLRGPFSQLSYTLEVGSLVEDLAKAKLEEKQEKLKAKAAEKLGDKLKDLFGK